MLYKQLRWGSNTQTFVDMLDMYSLHPLVNSVATRMTVPICLREQYPSFNDGLSGSENLNVKPSMLPLFLFHSPHSF